MQTNNIFESVTPPIQTISCGNGSCKKDPIADVQNEVMDKQIQDIVIEYSRQYLCQFTIFLRRVTAVLLTPTHSISELKYSNGSYHFRKDY